MSDCLPVFCGKINCQNGYVWCSRIAFLKNIFHLKLERAGACYITFGQGWPGVHGHVLVAASLLVSTLAERLSGMSVAPAGLSVLQDSAL